MVEEPTALWGLAIVIKPLTPIPTWAVNREDIMSTRGRWVGDGQGHLRCTGSDDALMIVSI